MDDGGFNLRPGVETSISMRKARMLPGRPGRRGPEWRRQGEGVGAGLGSQKAVEGDRADGVLSMRKSTGAEIGWGAGRAGTRKKGPDR